MAVRFGNVVGSSGSVIPVFRRQIEQGGPVTVTHPDVNRYFMTIPEASQMILQAGTMGEGGEVFILRMGTPVKIADMARDLIRLSGKEPDVDIKIIFIGLRDGEKLYEELIAVGEDILPTGHEKIMVLRSNHQSGEGKILQESREMLEKKIDELMKDALRHDSCAIKKILKEIVPEYTPQENEAVL
jgi:FlaA1/EpsC-like NDP-sugar epimerase